jgi:FkbM family methyltransferase
LHAYIRYFPSQIAKKAVWENLAAHLWWLESFAKAKTQLGFTLHVDARDICGRYIFYFGIWEPNLTAWIQESLKPGDTFVDVGANVGYFSLAAAGFVGPSGKVVAIEAAPRTFKVLTENLKDNNALNIRPVNAAVWDREESVTIFTTPDSITGTSTLIPAWAEQWQLEGRTSVTAKPLAALLETEELRNVRLIKIDVEGAEWRVISGMTSVLESGRRDLELIMEVATKIEVEGHSYKDIFALFRRQGFFAYRIENDYSASSYIAKGSPKRPTRIEQIPTDVDQIDVIFSRRDLVSL